ncbi:hypothetical protein FACS1894164_11570 [Spirochaetia bacterium]|nr:hypothetical protein FACS1894164_11570 [Spirochaetia bacterium]
MNVLNKIFGNTKSGGEEEWGDTSLVHNIKGKRTQLTKQSRPVDIEGVKDHNPEGNKAPSKPRASSDGTKMVGVSSSNVRAVGYDKEKKKMKVRFNNGSEYEYDDVPGNIPEALRVAPSVGHELDKRVKKAGYSYRKV